MVTIKETKKYHKIKKRIPRIIYKKIDKHEIIHGSRVLNKRFPQYLEKETTDYDLYSKTPKKDAVEVEKALDKRFGFNAFRTETAIHKSTWKVRSNVTGEGVADYTKPERKIPYDVINGKKYVKLGFVKKHILKTLKDPSASFRHEKDRDALNRIKIFEKTKKWR